MPPATTAGHDGPITDPPPVSLAAVVVNPSKLTDPEKFRTAVRAAMTEHGWSEPMWLETTRDDPGEGQARTAAKAGAELVLACGGDGTVTAAAAHLWEIDGEVMGRTRQLVVTVKPGTLLVRVPAPNPGGISG
jgi:diacylglycerol kinase family enzyme